MTELRHALGSQQITQWVNAEISQPSIGGEPVDYQIACGAGQDGLAAVRQSAQPRGAVDSRPDVVAIFTSSGRRRCACRCAAGSAPRVLAVIPAHTPRRRWHVRTQPRKLSPSHCSTGRTPPWAATTSDRVRSSCATTAVISPSWFSHSRREPSRSALSSVTVPVGSNSSPPRRSHSLPVFPRNSIFAHVRTEEATYTLISTITPTRSFETLVCRLFRDPIWA